MQYSSMFKIKAICNEGENSKYISPLLNPVSLFFLNYNIFIIWILLIFCYCLICKLIYVLELKHDIDRFYVILVCEYLRKVVMKIILF